MIDKNYIGERFFCFVFTIIRESIQSKRFLWDNEGVFDFWVFDEKYLFIKKKWKKTYIWYRINIFKELISLFSRYNILYTLF